MRVLKNNGDIIDCTVAEYVTMNQFIDTKVVHEHHIDLTAPKPKNIDLPNQIVTFTPKKHMHEHHINPTAKGYDLPPTFTPKKHSGGRPKLHKVLRKDGKEDGRSIMFKYLAKQAHKYRLQGFTQKKAYKKAMQDYKAQK